MTNQSLLDLDSGQPEDGPPPSTATPATLNELYTAVEVIKSNYVTKEEIALLAGKLDVLAANQQAFQAQALQTFATKAELSNAVYQLTWRMAGFTALLLSAGFAFARFL
ncbi:hypothetical protein [Duganella sp. BuS-21]|uniref:hypothetical protein n=1 Tax=Duganella sp. BuS-21 TaxID=2943848 RepID=UPI0035A6AFFC